MSDLRIEGTVFEDLRRTFSTVVDRMDTARRALRNTDASVVGSSWLADDLYGFSDDWGYGMKQLGKHADNAVKMIDKIGKAFGELDHELAESMKPKKGK